MPCKIPRLVMCKILFPWVIMESSMRNTAWHLAWKNEVIIEQYYTYNYVFLVIGFIEMHVCD